MKIEKAYKGRKENWTPANIWPFKPRARSQTYTRNTIVAMSSTLQFQPMHSTTSFKVSEQYQHIGSSYIVKIGQYPQNIFGSQSLHYLEAMSL